MKRTVIKKLPFANLKCPGCGHFFFTPVPAPGCPKCGVKYIHYDEIIDLINDHAKTQNKESLIKARTMINNLFGEEATE